MGAEDYGLYFSLYGFVFLFQFINEPGIQNNNVVFLSQNRSSATTHIPKLLGIKLGLFAVFSIVAAMVASMVGYTFENITLIVGIAFIFFLSTLFVLLRSCLSSIGQYRLDTWLSSLDKLLLILIIGTLLIRGANFTIAQFISIQVGCYLFCCIIAMVLLFRHGVSLKPRFEFKYSIQFLKSSLPFAGIILLSAIITRIDGVLLERLLEDGKYQAGLYAAGYRFVDAANMFGLLFGALLLPMYGNNSGNVEKTNELFDISFRLLFVVSLTVAGSLFFYSDEMIQLFYNQEYEASIPIMKMLMVSVVPIIFTHVFGSLLMTHHQMKNYNLVLILAALAAVLLNAILISKYKGLGASITCIVTQFFILTGMIYITLKNDLVQLSTGLVIKCFLFAATVIAAFIIIKYTLQVHWMMQLVITLILLFFAALIVKLIDYEHDIKNLRNS